MKTRLAVLSCCITMAALLAFAQSADEGYQTAGWSPSKESPPIPSIWPMEIATRFPCAWRTRSDVCRASGSAATFIDWTIGKEFPTRLNGKVLQVKNPNGQIVELTIAGKKTQK